jgi:hypothetical protein
MLSDNPECSMSDINSDRVRRNILAIRDRLSEALRQTIRHGHEGLRNLPALISEALEREVWEERVIAAKGGEHFAGFGSFAEYVKAGPPAGLGTSEEVLYSLLTEHPETRDLLDRALSRPRDGSYVIITLRTDDLTGMASTLRRHLSRDRILELIGLLR